MICPMCAAEVPVHEAACRSCGAGLVEYATLWYLPDHLFNEGVTCLNRDHLADAATWFAQACGLRPHDVEARRAWAYACHLQGRNEEAATILLDAMDIAPSPDLDEQYAHVISALEAPVTAHTVREAPFPVTVRRFLRAKAPRAARKRRH